MQLIILRICAVEVASEGAEENMDYTNHFIYRVFP